MHELSIALSIVDGVLEEAQRHGAASVEVVYLRLGRLSGVDREALLFSYRIATQDTPLAKSRLIVDDVDVTLFCPVCRGERPSRGLSALVCSACGAIGEGIVHGEELEISKLEIAA
jgi:hydrogenase nickel incorporation protein HypA/HybF